MGEVTEQALFSYYGISKGLDGRVMRIMELKEKEVINICDCKKLGCVADVNIDPCTGCVCELIVPECNKMFCLFGEEFEYVIPWCCVRQLGEDIILVEVKTKEVRKLCN